MILPSRLQWPREVRTYMRRPLSQILGTEAAAMIGKSEPHVRGNATRKAKAKADPVMEGFGGH